MAQDTHPTHPPRPKTTHEQADAQHPGPCLLAWLQGRLRIGLRLVGRHGRHRGLLVGRPSRLAVRRLSRLLEGLLGRLSVCAPGRPRLAVPIWCRLARLPLQRLLAVRALRRHVARLLAARGLLGRTAGCSGWPYAAAGGSCAEGWPCRYLRLSGLSRPLRFGHDCSLSSPRKASAVVATSSMASCGQASTHRPQPMQWRASSCTHPGSGRIATVGHAPTQASAFSQRSR